MGKKMRPCDVCGSLTIEDEYDICDVCGWEKDTIQVEEPDDHGVNNMSLNEARKIWESGQALWPNDYPRQPVNG